MSNTTSNSVTNANRGGGSGGGGGGKCVDSSLGQEVPCTSNGGWWSSETNCYLYLPPGSMPIDAANNYIWVCQGQGSIVQKTVIAPLSAAGPVAPPPPPDPRDVAQLAIKSMALHAIKIGMAPPPGQGNVGVIGLPTWMWVADPGASTTGPNTKTASIRGYSVTATARLTDITWNMGDGQTVVCNGPGTPYQASNGKSPSPDCGHTYSRSGNYTVTATSHWDVAWSGLGQQGNIPVTLTQTTQLTEVELQAIGQR